MKLTDEFCELGPHFDCDINDTGPSHSLRNLFGAVPRDVSQSNGTRSPPEPGAALPRLEYCDDSFPRQSIMWPASQFWRKCRFILPNAYHEQVVFHISGIFRQLIGRCVYAARPISGLRNEFGAKYGHRRQRFSVVSIFFDCIVASAVRSRTQGLRRHSGVPPRTQGRRSRH